MPPWIIDEEHHHQTSKKWKLATNWPQSYLEKNHLQPFHAINFLKMENHRIFNLQGLFYQMKSINILLFSDVLMFCKRHSQIWHFRRGKITILNILILAIIHFWERFGFVGVFDMTQTYIPFKMNTKYPKWVNFRDKFLFEIQSLSPSAKEL